MQVSYSLDRNPGMYPVRYTPQTFSSQYIPMPSHYGDFTGYQHVTGMGDLHLTPGVWSPADTQEEWPAYGPCAGFPGLSAGDGQIRLSSPTLTCIPAMVPSAVPCLDSPARQDSQGRDSHDWIKHNVDPTNPGGKTRTKDKYRVVYTDHQRLELEKEFHYCRYITIRRKAELATALSLSERQVKIWFQNRRAKERKQSNRKLPTSQHASTITPLPPAPNVSDNLAMATKLCSEDMLSDATLISVEEEY